MRNMLILEKKDDKEIVLRTVLRKVQTGRKKDDGSKYYIYRVTIPYRVAVDFDECEVQVIVRKIQPK